MSDGPDQLAPAGSEFLLYSAPDRQVRVRVLLADETVWLSQKGLAELFAVTRATVSRHLKNIFESAELQAKAVVTDRVTTASDGKRYTTRFYHLDTIIAVGYRVNSYEATQFRIWATQTLREFIVKGFVLDDERLKQGAAAFGQDYFDELLERIREIRASERRFYQKVTDLYATAIDYDKDAPITREFFAAVQNKLLVGKTAAEIVHAGADAAKPHMGLRSWKHAPDGKILKSDVRVAKNYLSAVELSELNRVVSAYLDLAENRARRGLTTKMADWMTFLDAFLQLNAYEILEERGKVSQLEAKLKAESEYETFRQRQDAAFESDFDGFVDAARALAGESEEPSDG